MIERAELAAWLQLLETPGLGRSTARQLLAAFGSPQAVFEADPAEWRRVVGPATAQALSQVPEQLPSLIDATIAWLAAASEAPRHLVTLGDPNYPSTLLATADPPLLLYGQGRIDLLQAESLAVVGSRNPTAQGRDNARAFAHSLAGAGWTIVSGLALGIDAAAHEGALEAAAHGGASTIAVVGTGLDTVYPRRHAGLARRIAAQGLMLSEFALGAPPLAAHFPQRNRLIAGLARGTLVVEAALQSGSLITARLANEAGREVFAIPGSIHSPQSRGCHWLIKQGAKLVESAQDVLEELTPGRAPAAPAATMADDESAEPASDPLLDALGYEPMTLDALAARTGWATAELSARLLEHELHGRVARLPGQLFQRIKTV